MEICYTVSDMESDRLLQINMQKWKLEIGFCQDL